MGLKSLFRRIKRKRTTRQSGFRDYQNNRPNRRKPIKPKKPFAAPSDRAGQKAARNRIRIWVILKLLFILAIFGLVIYAAFFTRFLEIQKIDVKGDADTIEEQAAVTAYLQAYMGKNMLIFSTTKHEAALMEEYSYLKNLNISRRPLHTLIATLTTYEHLANIQVTHEDGSVQLFVANELGNIANLGTTEEGLPTIVMDVTGTDFDLPEIQDSLALNQEIIDKDVLETLLDAKTNFEGKFNMQILEMQYLKRARELHFFTERYFYVWIDLTQSVDVQLAKLKKSMTQLNIYESPLEHIDLRISGQNGEKVIYKLSE